MAYKVGGTTVIDNSGNINWSAIQKDLLLTKISTRTFTTGTGNKSNTYYRGFEFLSNNRWRDVNEKVLSNCNCNCDCRC